MHAAVGGVGTRADRGGIGGPHARRRAAGGEERHRFLRRTADHLLVAAGEAQATQRSGIRAGLRSEYPLLETHLHQRLHLRQALLRRFLRVGHRLAVALRSDIAVGQAAVVVGRADQAVEIHFMGIHRLIPGVRVAGRDTAGAFQRGDRIGAVIGGVVGARPVVAGRADTAERRAAGGAGELLVPVDDAGAAFHEELLETLAGIRQQPGGQAVLGGVGFTDRRSEIGVADHLQQRPEELFVRSLGHRADVEDARGQQGRRRRSAGSSPAAAVRPCRSNAPGP